MSPAIFLFLAAVAAQGDTGSFVIHNFRFASGEVLPELRLHYRTLGQPRRDAAGRVRNAVLVSTARAGRARSSCHRCSPASCTAPANRSIPPRTT